MYFLIEPKTDIKDFFDYKHEYKLIKDALKRKEKIIAIFGVRRVGKTSLMNVVYHEIDGMKVWIDGRIISDPKKEIPDLIYECVKENRSKIFGRIDTLNISIYGIGIGLKTRVSQLDFERLVKNKRIFVFIDEAQRMNMHALSDTLSFFYDRFPNITFLVSGSEVGLLQQVFSDNPEAPLFGRHIQKVFMNRLNKNTSFEYLKQGFSQVDVGISESEMWGAVDVLDGLIGWLTYFGYERGIIKNKNALGKTKKVAVQIVSSELFNFLGEIRNRLLYLSIIRNANELRWSELHTYVNKDLKEYINPNSFDFALSKLMNYSFIEKRNDRYVRADPLLLDAALYLSKS